MKPKHARTLMPFSFIPAIASIVSIVVICPTPTNAIDTISHDRLKYAVEYYTEDNALLALRSYAVGHWTSTSHCTASMISPSLAITAAHCDDTNPGVITFRRYQDQDHFTWTDDSYNCTRNEVSSFWSSDSDVAIWHCDPNAGVLPGDKYGFIDLNRDVLVWDDMKVANVWTHPVVDDHGPGDWNNVLISTGKLTSTDGHSWPVPSCETDTERYSHRANLYGARGGSSGSMWLATPYGYISGWAPNSTGMFREEGYGLNTAHLYYVTAGSAAGDIPWAWRDSTVNPPPFPMCDAAYRTDELDANNDGIFDVLMEHDVRLAQREFYSFNIDTTRRRARWFVLPPSPDYNFEWKRETSDYSAYRTAAAVTPNYSTFWTRFMQRELPIDPDRLYNVRIESRKVDDGKSYYEIGVQFTGPGCSSSVFYPAHYDIYEDPIEPYNLTFQINTDDCAGPMHLYFYYQLDGAFEIDRVSVHEADNDWSIIDFDDWDSREEWRQDDDSGTALITPDGRNDASGNPTWAGVSFGDPAKEWNENCMNHAIPLLPNRDYYVNFQVREKNPTLDDSYIVVKSQTEKFYGGGDVLFRYFTVSSFWSPKGWYYFRTGNYHDYYLSFGQKRGGSYYIDDINLLAY